MKKETKEFIDILLLNKDEMFKYVVKYLKDRCIRMTVKKDKYIYVHHHSFNKTRPLLTSHLDTINDMYNETPTLIIEGNIISSGNQAVLGGDDRAGVWIMLQLLDKGISDYDYLFCCDEEIGGIGSKEFAKDYKDLPYSCILSLDRRGDKEIASYGYDNEMLLKIFTDKGYTYAKGSFTDCVNISSVNKMSCYNLSVGYNYEHTSEEIQNIQTMYNVLALLRDKGIIDKLTMEVFEQEKRVNDNYLLEPLLCDCCGVHAPLYSVESYEYGYMVCADCVELY